MKRETWADLFAAYQNPLYRYLYRMCGSREVAEELLQETFYRAMLSFTLRDAKAVRAWLYKVARHLYIDWLRRQTAERKMVDSICRLVGRGYAGGDPETAYEQKEAAQTVERIMRQLPERMRTILYLFPTVRLDRRLLGDAKACEGGTDVKTRRLISLVLCGMLLSGQGTAALAGEWSRAGKALVRKADAAEEANRRAIRSERLQRLERAARFILERQDEHGAMNESGYINTDSNMLYALMGLIQAYDLTRESAYWRAVERGLWWLMSVQTAEGDWHLSYRREGDAYVPALPGSYRRFAAIRGVDTTMALFLYVAGEADKRTKNRELKAKLRQSAERAYRFLVRHNLDETDGLFWSSYQLREGNANTPLSGYRLYKVKYAADNAETYLGLRAAADLLGDPRADAIAERLKRQFSRFVDRKKGVIAVMLDERGETAMRPAYARWFATGWSAWLLRERWLFAQPLSVVADHMDDSGAYRQWEGTFTLSTLAFLLGSQAVPVRPERMRDGERYLFSVQQPNGGLADEADVHSTYVNLAGMLLVYLSRELAKKN